MEVRVGREQTHISQRFEFNCHCQFENLIDEKFISTSVNITLDMSYLK